MPARSTQSWRGWVRPNCAYKAQIWTFPAVISLTDSAFSSSKAEARLKSLFGVATLDGFGNFKVARNCLRLADTGPIWIMLGKAGCRILRRPVHIAPGSHMAIDAATRAKVLRSMSRR